MAEFLDFHFIVDKIAGDKNDSFITVVAEAPVSRFGHSFGVFNLHERFEMSALVNLTRGPDNKYRLEQPVQQASSAIGRMFFQTLFPEGSAAYELLGRSCQESNRSLKWLRLKLELHPELTDLPWELIQSPWSGSWAVEINKTKLSVIRYLGNLESNAEQSNPLQGDQKYSVIVVRADPKDCHQQDVADSLETEWNSLKNALARLPSGLVEHRLVIGKSTLGQLAQYAGELEKQGLPVIGLHFMGHGSIDEQGGFFAGEDAERNIHRIYAEDLLHALYPCSALRWVILNACWTAAEPVESPLAGLATSLSLVKNTLTVIAYRRPVRSADAEKLAARFYEDVLGNGISIEEVIRSVQYDFGNPGGLVVMLRAIEGRIHDSIHFSTKRTPSQGELNAKLAGSPTATDLPLNVQEQPSVQPPTERSIRPPKVESLKPEDGMILIPAGPFKKGLTQQQINHVLSQFQNASLEMDSARVTLAEEREETKELPAYYIDRTPVTNAEFRRFVEANGHITEAEVARERRNWRMHDSPEKADHPVVYVSFADAEAYCRWANKRLPTADEWKKAYRGSEGRLYPWGNSFDLKKCNTAESERGQETTSVDKFPNGASQYGCLDMVGNVEEWTATVESNMKLVLGGSWAMTCELYGLPVLHRLAPPRFYSNDLGFRCAKNI